mmetsp:Transcript_90437/g.235451  ORF Transcript_90437/g.235451 Transcript_90437/m.235451 type:complete len:240 (+) Transcript_90437:117-836(+)
MNSGCLSAPTCTSTAPGSMRASTVRSRAICSAGGLPLVAPAASLAGSHTLLTVCHGWKQSQKTCRNAVPTVWCGVYAPVLEYSSATSAASSGLSGTATPSKDLAFQASTQLPFVRAPSGKMTTGPPQDARAFSDMSLSCTGCSGGMPRRRAPARLRAPSNETCVGSPPLAGNTKVGQSFMHRYKTSVKPCWFAMTKLPRLASKTWPVSLAGGIFSLRWSARQFPAGTTPTANSAAAQPK